MMVRQLRKTNWWIRCSRPAEASSQEPKSVSCRVHGSVVESFSKSVVQASGLHFHNGSAMGCEMFIRSRDNANVEKGELGHDEGLPQYNDVL